MAAAPAAAPMAAAAAPAARRQNALADAAADENGQAGEGRRRRRRRRSSSRPSARNFADTAFWVGALTTDKDGVAEVELDMPENLTAWKIKVWGMGHGTKVGEGEAEVVTRKNLIVRLQAPRFFVQKDEVVLSANVHNYLQDREGGHASSLELDGDTLKPHGRR